MSDRADLILRKEYTYWKYRLIKISDKKGMKNELDELVHQDTLGADHCGYYPGDYYFLQDQFQDRITSHDAFHSLDHLLCNPHRDHNLVVVAG